jgi:hypothetical protein
MNNVNFAKKAADNVFLMAMKDADPAIPNGRCMQHTMQLLSLVVGQSFQESE